jgi:glucokinase
VEAVGVDLGGTKMLVGVVDSGYEVRHRSEELLSDRGGDALLDQIARAAVSAREARPDAATAGLGIPCTIDRARGVAINAVNLDLSDVPVRDEMRERLGIPVFVDNDANVAMLAEHRLGAARGAQNAVMLTIGTGIGGGLLLNGQIYRGASGAGAELGHMVVDLDGPPCQGTCPNRGCLEAIASGTALAREGRVAAERDPDSALGGALADGQQIDGRLVTDSALAGDETAVGVLGEIGRRLGAGLAGLANVFEPEMIVIGGGVMAAGDLLLQPARKELRARALPPMDRTPVVPAELGPEAGMIGAATMAMMEFDPGE